MFVAESGRGHRIRQGMLGGESCERRNASKQRPDMPMSTRCRLILPLTLRAANLREAAVEVARAFGWRPLVGECKAVGTRGWTR